MSGTAARSLAGRLRSLVPDDCLLLPSSPGYDRARPVYNRMHDARPAAIVRSLDETVLHQAVSTAAELGVRIAVRGGGHHIGGFSTVEDGLLIDFSVFRGVFPDPGAGTVRVQPGARLADLDARLSSAGRCVPSGTVSDTGVTGLTLGGGIGWLVAEYGLTCDHLIGARVLAADGRVLEVSPQRHPDLLFALRGGGVGAFGIVLELRFRTIPLPRITAGSVRFPLDRAAGVLRRLHGLLRERTPVATTLAPALVHRDGVPELSVDLCCHDDGAQAARIREAIGGDWSDVVARDYREWQAHFDSAFLPPMRGYWKSVHFPHLALDPDTLVAAMRAAPTARCSAVVEYFNPDTLRARAEGSAYPLRESRMGVLLSARWPDRGDDDAHVRWARTWADTLRAAGGAKAYSNYSDASDSHRSLTLDDPVLGGAFRRLERAYDPDRLFARGHRTALTG
ncbi:FAD-binding oxidoreductase [Actinacidiphila sp. ITFR-21]|uniref:FAD-binding oxidoreductase n=1 Tax=Actinacidiphila sp. ITFR-21 TaxID=3075199 RepID=UPI00288B8746|nr:FAD-binding oxidoreductase [Streptomyces sp. ITFR-21]WNI18658.1 FAD-binding oxidoreductase [Streptomyces sp. ITFR-21]